MKRFEKQSIIASAARTLAKNLKSNNAKPNIADTGTPFLNGEPQNTIGFVLAQAGISLGKKDVPGPKTAVALALGLAGSDGLPDEVKSAIQAVRDAEIGKQYPYQRRRAVVAPLLQFANVLASTKVRKPYVHSGLFTSAAKAAGTYGVAPAY